MEEQKLICRMRQRNKIIVPGHIYHITQRAPGIEQLFLEESDYLYGLHILKDKSKEFNLDIFSFVFMPNHLHLLMRINDSNLSKAMKSIFETYAMFFNNKYARKGHVFCGNYRCAICLDDSYLLSASLYIHLNPVKAGLVKNPADYRWSSCRLFVTPLKQKTFINYSYVLRVLDEDIDKARQLYEKLLYRAIDIKTENIIENPLGLETFRIKLFHNCNDICTRGNPLIGSELEESLNKLENKGRLRKPQEIRARKFFFEQLKSRGFSVSEIARRFNISRQGVYQTLNLTKQVEPKV